MVLGQKLGRESSALHVGCALEKGGFAGSAHQVAKQKALLPSHNWANWKKPAKIQVLKIRENDVAYLCMK